MSISNIVEQIKLYPDCEVLPPDGRTLMLPNKLTVPSDVQEFYKICNGVTLFKIAEYEYRVLSINEVVQMNPEYYGECWCDEKIISDSWYFIAESWNSDKIAIDTHPSRLGRCYDCFIGEGYPVIATSFEELLTRLFENKGEYTYWLKKDFALINPCDF